MADNAASVAGQLFVAAIDFALRALAEDDDAQRRKDATECQRRGDPDPGFRVLRELQHIRQRIETMSDQQTAVGAAIQQLIADNEQLREDIANAPAAISALVATAIAAQANSGVTPEQMQQLADLHAALGGEHAQLQAALGGVPPAPPDTGTAAPPAAPPDTGTSGAVPNIPQEPASGTDTGVGTEPASPDGPAAA